MATTEQLHVSQHKTLRRLNEFLLDDQLKQVNVTNLLEKFVAMHNAGYISINVYLYFENVLTRESSLVDLWETIAEMEHSSKKNDGWKNFCNGVEHFGLSHLFLVEKGSHYMNSDVDVVNLVSSPNEQCQIRNFREFQAHANINRLSQLSISKILKDILQAKLISFNCYNHLHCAIWNCGTGALSPGSQLAFHNALLFVKAQHYEEWNGLCAGFRFHQVHNIFLITEENAVPAATASPAVVVDVQDNENCFRQDFGILCNTFESAKGQHTIESLDDVIQKMDFILKAYPNQCIQYYASKIMQINQEIATRRSQIGLENLQSRELLFQSPPELQADRRNETPLLVEKEIKEKVDVPQERACCICLEEEKTFSCIPCGHVNYCTQCSSSQINIMKRNKEFQCPICRKPVNQILRIFF